ncbi:MAG: hypothetical protein U0271_24805 [Polyangiaceae bacterium]
MRQPVALVHTLPLLGLALGCSRGEPVASRDSAPPPPPSIATPLSAPAGNELASPNALTPLASASSSAVSSTPLPPPVVLASATPAPSPKGECRPGQRQSCVPGGEGAPYDYCVRTPRGFRFTGTGCNTPLVVAFDDAPVEFITALSARRFAIGASRRTEWVSAKTPWLARDLDESGCIEDEAELFGASSGAANGFESLRRLDADASGAIDSADPAFATLLLWRDVNEDRVCEPAELEHLAHAGITRIELAYTGGTPTAGSYEGERAAIELDTRGARRARVVDVYLAPITGQ